MEYNNFKAAFRPEIRHLRIPDLPEIPKNGRTTYDQVFGNLKVKQKGGITEVGLVDRLIGEEFMFGVAYCSHQENYKKKKGRSIGLGRLMRDMSISFSGQDAQNVANLFVETGAKFNWDIVLQAFLGKKIE